MRRSSQLIADPSLVLWLPLMDIVGGSFISRGFQGHLCTPTGAYATPLGWNFDGSDDEIDIPDSAVFDVAQVTMTAVVFLRTHSVANGEGIVCRGPFGSSHGPYQLFFAGGATPKPTIRINAGGGAEISTTSAITLNRWNHIVGTYDGVNMVVYVNAVPDGTDAYSTAIAASTDSIKIGPYYATNRPMDGLIADVQVYNRAFRAMEVHKHYLETKQRIPWL